MFLRSIVPFAVFSGLVAAGWVVPAQAGEWVAPKVKEVQARPVLGVYGPVTINYVTGEITQGKKQARATVVYSNTDESSEQGVGLGGTGLDPWGDDLVCVYSPQLVIGTDGALRLRFPVRTPGGAPSD